MTSFYFKNDKFSPHETFSILRIMYCIFNIISQNIRKSYKKILQESRLCKILQNIVENNKKFLIVKVGIEVYNLKNKVILNVIRLNLKRN